MSDTVKTFTSLFVPPAADKPDTADLRAQEAEARKREEDDRRKAKATLAAAAAGGRFKLFSAGGERGLRETLG